MRLTLRTARPQGYREEPLPARPLLERARRVVVLLLVGGVIYVPGVVAIAMLVTGHAR